MFNSNGTVTCVVCHNDKHPVRATFVACHTMTNTRCKPHMRLGSGNTGPTALFLGLSVQTYKLLFKNPSRLWRGNTGPTVNQERKKRKIKFLGLDEQIQCPPLFGCGEGPSCVQTLVSEMSWDHISRWAEITSRRNSLALHTVNDCVTGKWTRYRDSVRPIPHGLRIDFEKLQVTLSSCTSECTRIYGSKF